jgi:hypothetical protein
MAGGPDGAEVAAATRADLAARGAAGLRADFGALACAVTAVVGFFDKVRLEK